MDGPEETGLSGPKTRRPLRFSVLLGIRFVSSTAFADLRPQLLDFFFNAKT